MTARISLRNGSLALESPYDPALVYALKQAIPASDRQWDKGARVWLVSPQFGPKLVKLCDQFGYGKLTLPAVQPISTTPVMRVFKLEYLGGCKDRDDGTISAFGYCEGAWSVVIPESVLKAWFEGGSLAENQAPSERPTLYKTLGITAKADQDDIKKAYRRMARQWHPDTSSEPNSHEMFLSIKAAYDVLGDTIKRKKYDAGLLFEQRSKTETSNPYQRIFAPVPELFRSPLRCGMVLAEATQGIKWSVSKILAWDDVTRADGQILVSSWDSANNRIRYEWTLP